MPDYCIHYHFHVTRCLCMGGWSIVYTTSCSVASMHPWFIWACVSITSRATTIALNNMCIERQSHYWEHLYFIGRHHTMHSFTDLISKHASPQCVLSRFTARILKMCCFFSSECLADFCHELIFVMNCFSLDAFLSSWVLWWWLTSISPLSDMAHHNVVCSGSISSHMRYDSFLFFTITTWHVSFTSSAHNTPPSLPLAPRLCPVEPKKKPTCDCCP